MILILITTKYKWLSEVDDEEGEEEEEVDSSDEEIDPDAPIDVGKPIDRTKIKTTSDRNRIKASKAKL